jgi:hypothetical protein
MGSTPTTRFSVVGLSCGNTYTIGIEAYDSSGNSSERATVLAATSPCYDAQPPSPPSGITQIASTDSSATISWSPSGDNVGVVGYHVLGTTTATTYSDTTVASSTT